MISRRWRGVTRPADAAAYHKYLRGTGLADYRATPGNLGVLVEQWLEENRAVFVLTSFWESEDAIRAFAGSDIRVARYYPEDDRFLLEKTPYVDHAEVVFFDFDRALLGRRMD